MIQVTTGDHYEAGLLFYLGYEIVCVRISQRGAEFVFSVGNESVLTELRESWNSSEGCVLSNAKLFCEALKQVNGFKGQAHRNPHGQWDNKRYLGLESK